MRSPVQEIQELATDPAVDLIALLRKSLLVATKLHQNEFAQWIRCELNGYDDKPDVPPYRKLNAEAWVKNPVHGLVPWLFGDSKLSDAFCRISVRDPIGSLKHVVDNHQNGRSSPTYPFTPQQISYLMQHQDFPKNPPVRTLSENQLASILDVVRTAILEWALKLEQDGILGEGVAFTPEEVRRASTSTNISIGNFQGVVGNIQGSTVAQSFSMNVQQGVWGSLEEYLRSVHVRDDDIAELKKAVADEPTLGERGTFGKSVSAWIGRMAAKAANGVWDVAIGVATGLLTSALKAYYRFPGQCK